MFKRLAETERPSLRFMFDGVAYEAMDGDTILTAILTNQPALGRSEFNGTARAGFCLMGACQDCWVEDNTGHRLRACATPLRAGMTLRSLGGTR